MPPTHVLPARVVICLVVLVAAQQGGREAGRLMELTRCAVHKGHVGRLPQLAEAWVVRVSDREERLRLQMDIARQLPAVGRQDG